MSIRFRPYDRDRRFVWPVPFATGTKRARWLALHAAPPDWHALFIRALDLMLIEAVCCDGSVILGEGLGRVCCRGGAAWTIIDVDLAGMSEKKQAVVQAALLKAARYVR